MPNEYEIVDKLAEKYFYFVLHTISTRKPFLKRAQTTFNAWHDYKDYVRFPQHIPVIEYKAYENLLRQHQRLCKAFDHFCKGLPALGDKSLISAREELLKHCQEYMGN